MLEGIRPLDKIPQPMRNSFTAQLIGWFRVNNFAGFTHYGDDHYLGIVNMGRDVVPLALAHMQETGRGELAPLVLSYIDDVATLKSVSVDFGDRTHALVSWGLASKLITPL